MYFRIFICGHLRHLRLKVLLCDFLCAFLCGWSFFNDPQPRGRAPNKSITCPAGAMP